MLNRDLESAKAENNPEAVKDILDDLQYALNHKPTSKSDLGEDKTTKRWGNGTNVAGDAEDSTERVKQVGDKILIEQCGMEGCHAWKCDIASHQTWVEWNAATLNW